MWNLVCIYCLTLAINLSGFVMFLFSFSSTHWLVCKYDRKEDDNRVFIGLWKICHESNCTYIDMGSGMGHLKATQILCIVALMLILTVIVFLLIAGYNTVKASTHGDDTQNGVIKKRIIVISVLSTLAGLLILVGVPLFPTDESDPIVEQFCTEHSHRKSWSFYLGLSAGAAFVLDGAIICGLMIKLTRTHDGYSQLT